MSQPFLGQLAICSFNFPPKGWAFCNGQLLQINQNQALFSILGTTYGGDGRTTFGLPNLQGRVPLHFGPPAYVLGQFGGTETVTLTTQQMPLHTHGLQDANTLGNTDSPVNASIATVASGSQLLYSNANPTGSQTLNPAAVTNYGGSQPHENRQPYLVLNFIIALQGIFPSRN